jgi:hypothetical protein
MIDGHPLQSHSAQYVPPVGLAFGGVTIDDILLDRVRDRDVARLRAAMALRRAAEGIDRAPDTRRLAALLRAPVGRRGRR